MPRSCPDLHSPPLFLECAIVILLRAEPVGDQARVSRLTGGTMALRHGRNPHLSVAHSHLPNAARRHWAKTRRRRQHYPA